MNKNKKKISTKKSLVIAIIIFSTWYIVFPLSAYLVGKGREQTNFESIDEFWKVYPCSRLIIPEEFTKNATDIEYYAYNNIFEKNKVYGISMVLDEEEYEKFKKGYSGEVRLKYTSDNGQTYSHSAGSWNKLNDYMFSLNGQICLTSLGVIDIPDYEIFDFDVQRTRDNHGDGTISGEGIFGDDEKCKIISFYSYEDDVDFDYYLDMISLIDED